MARVQLVISDRELAKRTATALRGQGHVVITGNPDPSKVIKRPPDAMVFDLSAAPSHTRDAGLYLRSRKATRGMALVYVGGTAQQVAGVKKYLPDAVFVKTWRGLPGAVKRSLANPRKSPAKPTSVMAGYSGTPLPKKLGIKPQSTLILVNAPKDFESTLGELPEGVTIRRRASGTGDVAIWFIKSQADLEQRVVKMGGLAPGLWIAWPKQASGVSTDLTGNIVRSTGLANGLVDYKICAIDATWSGLKFARRKS